MRQHIEMFVQLGEEPPGPDYDLGLRLRELFFQIGIFNFQTTAACETFVDQLLQDFSKTMSEDWLRSHFDKKQTASSDGAPPPEAKAIEAMRSG